MVLKHRRVSNLSKSFLEDDYSQSAKKRKGEKKIRKVLNYYFTPNNTRNYKL